MKATHGSKYSSFLPHFSILALHWQTTSILLSVVVAYYCGACASGMPGSVSDSEVAEPQAFLPAVTVVTAWARSATGAGGLRLSLSVFQPGLPPSQAASLRLRLCAPLAAQACR